MFILDDQARIQRFNLAAERMTGYRKGEVINTNVKLLLEPEFAKHNDSEFVALGGGHHKCVKISTMMVIRWVSLATES
jgi:PAS domain S-box-containing protein